MIVDSPAHNPDRYVPADLGRNLTLAVNLAVNDFRLRHARSLLGLLWLVLTPMGMLLVYWAVFGYTLNISWPGPEGTNVGFVLPFFVGYSIYMYFSDVITSSLNLFVSKRNYVRKSPFPLWVLWAANMIRAGLQGGVYLILVVVMAVATGLLTVSGLLLFIATVSAFLLFAAAVSLFLAALGPFLNDLSEAARVILRVLFYVAPIAYPLAIVPAKMQSVLWLNPLTNIIEPARNALIFSAPPEFMQFSVFLLISLVMLVLCLWFFRRVSEAIVDVV